MWIRGWLEALVEDVRLARGEGEGGMSVWEAVIREFRELIQEGVVVSELGSREALIHAHFVLRGTGLLGLSEMPADCMHRLRELAEGRA